MKYVWPLTVYVHYLPLICSADFYIAKSCYVDILSVKEIYIHILYKKRFVFFFLINSQRCVHKGHFCFRFLLYTKFYKTHSVLYRYSLFESLTYYICILYQLRGILMLISG